MLALQPLKLEQKEKCTPNVLPCRINQTGPAKVTKRYWSVREEKDGSQTVHFRGRRLRGRRVKIPDGYQGIVATQTDRYIQQPQSAAPVQVRSSEEDNDDNDDDVDEEKPEPVKMLDVGATFDEFVVWGHESLPAADDTFVKGIDEWISFAEAIHKEPVKG